MWHDIEQRIDGVENPDWLRMRLGIVTSSDVDRIITPSELKLSSSSDAYLNQKLAEWITGEPVETFTSGPMDRGQALEDQAVSAYEGLTDTPTTRGGFFTSEDGMQGCSPDRLIGDAGDLEIKCPLLHTQVGYWLKGASDKKHVLQVQHRMMIHGREWADLFAFHPAMIIPPVRIYRDEKTIGAIRFACEMFVGRLLDAQIRFVREFGEPIRPKPPVMAAGGVTDFISDEDAEAIIAMRRSM